MATQGKYASQQFARGKKKGENSGKVQQGKYFFQEKQN